MIKEQIIIVTNKSQLLTAFGCAISCDYPTKIILVRKTGKTFYNLNPIFTVVKYDRFGFVVSSEYYNNKHIIAARSKIRRTPAKCFR